MKNKLILTLSLFVILILPVALQESAALRQVAGPIEIDIAPGGSAEFEWGLASDKSNAVTTVELSTEGEGGEFLTFEKNVSIDPLKTVFTKVQVNIPEDYPGGIDLTPHLIATEFGEKGGATVINIRMLKIVDLNIEPNENPDLWVDWDAIRAAKESGIEFEDTPTEQVTQPQGEGMMIIQPDETKEVADENKEGGGCLIATAAYGSELAYQVQLLREIRDGALLSTASGSSFMTGFNQLYYMFSPTVADWERESPVFREAVKLFITPMISSLSIMTLAEPGSEESILGLGISVIALNLGMYIAAPAMISYKAHKIFKNKRN